MMQRNLATDRVKSLKNKARKKVETRVVTYSNYRRKRLRLNKRFGGAKK